MMNPAHTTDYTSPQYILILSYHLRLGLHSGLFPYGLNIKIQYAFLFLFPAVSVTCPDNSILLDFIIVTIPGEEYKL
jgi:hypothetical protein